MKYSKFALPALVLGVGLLMPELGFCSVEGTAFLRLFFEASRRILHPIAEKRSKSVPILGFFPFARAL